MTERQPTTITEEQSDREMKKTYLSMVNSRPLVAKKYSTYYGTDEFKTSHIKSEVCLQQSGLLINWCKENGIECYEDTHSYTIVESSLADRIDEFTMAKNEFFKSIGVNNISEMNEFSQGWDGFRVDNINELVVKVDRIDDLENAVVMVQCNLDNIEEEAAEGRLLVRGVYP
jgi:hypothetical protein|tara:strand:- start:1609 stop:2124 length:516 start_codon:yes stop_codon:yes gene_type:complete